MAFFTNCLTLRGIKGSALTHAELDNNFICLDTGLSNLSNVVNSLSGITGNAISGLTYDNGVLTLTEMDGNTFSVTVSAPALSAVTAVGNRTTTDIEITDYTKGVILRSPDNTRWRITVDNSGSLITTIVP